METQKRVRWMVGLSNGENICEGKGDFKSTEGELSPWQKLLKYLDEKNASITSLSLFVNERRWNLPSSGKNPKVKEFDSAEKPIKYFCFKKMTADILSGKRENEEFYVVAQAEYERDRKLQVWVLDKEPFPSWSLFI